MGASSLREFHLFSGAGGGILGGQLLGHQCVGAVEIDAYCQQVLIQRQRDGILPAFPIWDDVRTMHIDNPDTRPFIISLKEHAEELAICGGFPCQDISDAGKRQGISGARSGLWAEFARLVGEIRPRYAFIENVPGLAVRGLTTILSDLAALGYDARWCCLGADDVGAPHIRKRLWILAYRPRNGMEEQSVSTTQRDEVSDVERQSDYVSNTESEQMGIAGQPRQCRYVGDANLTRLAQREGQPGNDGTQQSSTKRGGGRNPESDMGVLANGVAVNVDGPWSNEPGDVPRVAQGISKRVAQIQALGNGQVPLCATVAWRILSDGLDI